MSEFYGRVQGNRGETHRGGSRASGIWATVETFGSVVKSRMFASGSNESGHQTQISVGTKYSGSTVLMISLDTDSLVDYYQDPKVMGKIREVEQAVNRLDREVEEAAERARR